jgi:thiamine biosynthesis protein ThiS|uniref:Thiamine biosynthesis protein S n=1 Tax=Discostella pseudostelligera TaxID=259834 RepID=A0A2U9NS47_9STRA|nr:thiamine biosynthesis protein S [Discostella pseudostelligera]AWT39954.1 thiamine biosynthesis protein S [Discostella pseudostelligera]
MKKTKRFFLNGQEFVSDKIINLRNIIHYFNYNSSLLVLEYNHFIYPKENWDNIFINDKDKIEIVTIVGGG